MTHRKEVPGQIGFDSLRESTREEKVLNILRQGRKRGILKALRIVASGNGKAGFADLLSTQIREYEEHKRYHTISEKYPNTTPDSLYAKCENIFALGGKVLEIEVCFPCEGLVDQEQCFIHKLAGKYGYQYAFEYGYSRWFTRAENRAVFRSQLRSDPDSICMPYHPNIMIDK